MFNAFSTAISALNANSTALSVAGDNLANLNTTGACALVVFGAWTMWRKPTV